MGQPVLVCLDMSSHSPAIFNTPAVRLDNSDGNLTMNPLPDNGVTVLPWSKGTGLGCATFAYVSLLS